jgi:hypothetical protein
MSERTIRRYLNTLGWKKVRAKYCQIVVLKNRTERIAYAYAALAFRDKFTDSIFIDESTVQSTKNAYKIWNKPFANETRLGLSEKYAHPISVNLLGGISRRGPTPLVIIKGISCYKIFIILKLIFKKGHLNRFRFTRMKRQFFRPF